MGSKLKIKYDRRKDMMDSQAKDPIVYPG